MYKAQDANVRKTWLLMALFLVIIIGLGWIFAQIYGNPVILYVAVGFSLVMNFVSYWYSDKVALSVSRATPADPSRFAELHRLVENLSITAGLPKPRVYVINDPAPNAFATGRDEKYSAVAVTTGLLERLEKTELEGVIAHELAHIKNRDILLQTIVVVLAGFVAIVSDIFIRSQFFAGGHDRNRGGAILVLVGIILSILAPIVASLIQLAISRKREFLADASGALLTRYPEGLARALEKISNHPTPLRSASNATAHLFIASPFGPQALRGMHKLFMTHPPVEERVRALRGMTL